MKNYKTSLISILKRPFVLLLVAIVAFGCEREMIQPDNTPLSLQNSSFNYLLRPVVQCAPSIYSVLTNGSSILGSVEMLNSSTDLHLLLDLQQGKFLDQVKLFTGDYANLPLDSDGNIQLERFGFQQIFGSPTNDYTLTIPLSTLTNTCNDIAIWAQVSSRNVFGQVTGTMEVWMDGNPHANGFYNPFCVTTCVVGQSEVTAF